MELDRLTTPALIVDRAIVTRNIERMGARMAAHGVALRPHLKTAKSAQVAALAVAGQAGGITVSSKEPLYPILYLSLAEALVMIGRSQEALGALERMEVLPANARAEYLRGLAYRDLGEVGDARTHLQRVLRRAPGSALASQALQVLESLPGGPD